VSVSITCRSAVSKCLVVLGLGMKHNQVSFVAHSVKFHLKASRSNNFILKMFFGRCCFYYVITD